MNWDIQKWVPDLDVALVFDVGANQGQSAKKFLHWFPGASIICFEPVEETFKQLELATKDNKLVTPVKLALGSASAKSKITKEGSSDTFFIANEEYSEGPTLVTEEVEIETIDSYCSKNNIEQINFLKIDTEGYDLEVLKGAGNMLKRQRIDVIQVEAGMSPINRRHVSLEHLKSYLEQMHYFLFGIYSQQHEWPAEAVLRRVDAVFIANRSL